MRPLFGRVFHLQDVNFVDYLLLEDKQLLTHDLQFCQYHLNAQANHPPRCFAQPQHHEGNKSQKTLKWGNLPWPMINIPVTQWTFEHTTRQAKNGHALHHDTMEKQVPNAEARHPQVQ